MATTRNSVPLRDDAPERRCGETDWNPISDPTFILVGRHISTFSACLLHCVCVLLPSFTPPVCPLLVDLLFEEHSVCGASRFVHTAQKSFYHSFDSCNHDALKYEQSFTSPRRAFWSQSPPISSSATPQKEAQVCLHTRAHIAVCQNENVRKKYQGYSALFNLKRACR